MKTGHALVDIVLSFNGLKINKINCQAQWLKLPYKYHYNHEKGKDAIKWRTYTLGMMGVLDVITGLRLADRSYCCLDQYNKQALNWRQAFGADMLQCNIYST